MSDETTAIETLTRLLAEEIADPREVAEIIVDSDWLAEQKAQAWDEGVISGSHHQSSVDLNPYRKEVIDD